MTELTVSVWDQIVEGDVLCPSWWCLKDYLGNMNVGWNEGTSPCLKSLCLDAHLLSWCDWAQSSHWVSLVEGCSVLYPSHLRDRPLAYIRRLHNAAAKWLQPSPMEGEVKLLNMRTLQQLMEGLPTGKAERVCCYRPVNLELAVTLAEDHLAARQTLVQPNPGLTCGFSGGREGGG